MKQKTLANLLMSRFTIFMVTILLMAAPLFYLIITHYYAEDLIRVQAMAHIPKPRLDFQLDTVVGLVIQILLMVMILGMSIFLIMRFVPVKLWRPFYDTLHKISHFKVEDGSVPEFETSNVKEFAELNTTLKRILSQNVQSYKVQKQFTENASHELQTPLAIVQSKLDLLLQDKNLTQEQATLMQDIYHEISRMSKLNRNLLLLAKIENAQYKLNKKVNIAEKIQSLIPSLELLADGIIIRLQIKNDQMTVNCNEVLLESLISNLVVNAVRHNYSDGEIIISLENSMLTVTNTSKERSLDSAHIFERFYRSSLTQKGNGLGLAIVKSICDYNHWTINYFYKKGLHNFSVRF
jgi:two-component system, OmpR family, sensor kinase